jgi:penicillin-binding protein 1A
MTPEDSFQDAPVTVEGWSPRNYGSKYVGAVSLKEALARSINTVAVRVSERSGRGHVREAARRLGITSNLPKGPALALGTAGVSLIEMTGVYAALANEGEGVWPYGIRDIRSSEGEILYRRAGSGPGRVIAPGNVARLHDMLGAVITLGTGKAAQIGRPAAGKTGTSQDFRDAWFIGYSAELVTGVWFGNDDNAPMAKVTGGGLPARLWRDFMLAAHEGLAPRPLPGAGFVAETPKAFSAPTGITMEVEAPYGKRKMRPGAGFWDDLMAGIGISR